ncbi:MAG: hypothetical protein R3325_13900 [Thermoanaerobaculia bacterium]|nr:hypothetical protein [Thermoanaerobaculia bacterium]
MNRRNRIHQLLALVCGLALAGFHDPPPQPLDRRAVLIALEEIRAVQVAPDASYVRRLDRMVVESPTPYLRERALATLTEIAVRRGEAERVVKLLERHAETAEDETVRTSAYAHLDLLRQHFPPERRSTLALSIRGPIAKGATVTLVATLSSTVEPVEEVVVGLDSLHENVELLGKSEVFRIFLKPGEPRDVEFELKLKETGGYTVPVTALVSFGRTDFERLESEGRLLVGESRGSFGDRRVGKGEGLRPVY